MKKTGALLIGFLAINAMAMADALPIRPITPPPVPRPPVVTNLYCLAGNQNWLHIPVALGPQGKLTVGSLSFRFQKADHRVTVDAQNNSNLSKGECGYRDSNMAPSAGQLGYFYDSNIAAKQVYLSLDTTIEGVNSNGQPVALGYTQTSMAQDYATIQPGTLFSVPVHVDSSSNLVVDDGGVPTILK